MAGIQYIILMISRLIVSGTFILAALPKIQNTASFSESIANIQFMSNTYSAWIALILPWLELVCAMGLLIPSIKRSCTAILSSLLTVFLGLHIIILASGQIIDCGCFGPLINRSEHPYVAIIQTAFLLLVSCLILYSDWNLGSNYRTLRAAR